VTGGLPRISGEAAIRALSRAGFEQVKQRGSHAKLRHATSGRVCVVPLHRELATGTLASILRQAGLLPEDLRALRDPTATWPPPDKPWPPPPVGPWPPR
jgi:predicted RNA binding protein YcfA (HicA-like mRNA interferase family)